MEEGPAKGFGQSISRLFDTGLAVAHNRVELLSVELREEKFRVIEVMILAGSIVVLGAVALTVLTFAVAWLCPERVRAFVLLGLALGYVALAAAGFRSLRAKLRNWEPFPGTLSELKKDRECLANWRNCEPASKNS